MSGDLLEDLMSSEGEFVYRETNDNYRKRVWKKIANWLCILCLTKRFFNTFQLLDSWPRFLHPVCLISFSVCFFLSSVLASPASVPSTQRPRLHIQPGWDRRPLWPLWRAHSQPLTPEIVVRAGNSFPNMLIYLNFLPSVVVAPPPPSDGEGEKRCRKANMIWWAFKDTSALTRSAQAELIQTVAPCTAASRNAGENKTFYLLLFQGVKTNDKIIIFLDCYVW